MENTITIADLEKMSKKWAADLLTQTAPPAPAPPVSVKQEPAVFPRTLDVEIDGRPVKAELVDAEAGVYTAQADMQMGAGGLIASGDGLRVLNVSLPIASAVVGMGGGMIVTTLVDGLVSPLDKAGKNNPLNAAAQLGATVAVLKFTPRYIGSTAATFAAGALLFSLALRWTPLMEYITKATKAIADPLNKVVPGIKAEQSGLAQAEAMLNQGRAGMGQADHYRGAL